MIPLVDLSLRFLVLAVFMIGMATAGDDHFTDDVFDDIWIGYKHADGSIIPEVVMKGLLYAAAKTAQAGNSFANYVGPQYTLILVVVFAIIVLFERSLIYIGLGIAMALGYKKQPKNPLYKPDEDLITPDGER